MNAMTVVHQELEIHQLKKPYAACRLPAGDLSNLKLSMEAVGQLVPIVVAQEKNGGLVLLDGHRRVSVLQKCAQDTVYAEVWHCEAGDGAIALLARMGGRQWDCLEEGLLMLRLMADEGLKAGEIAARMGRSPSWVRTRVQLVQELPAEGLQAIRTGKLSTWVASRIIAPLARSDQKAALTVIENAGKEGLSVREWKIWFDHYQAANHQIRERMVNNPTLFITCNKTKTQQCEARDLKAGLEGQWQQEVANLGRALGRMQQKVHALLQGQDVAFIAARRADILRLQRQYGALQAQIERSLEHAKTTQKGADLEIAPAGHVSAADPQNHRRGTSHDQQTDNQSEPGAREKPSNSGSPRPSHQGSPGSMPGQHGARARNPQNEPRLGNPLQHTDPYHPRGSP